MAQAQEGSWESVCGSLECPVCVDGWNQLYQLHLTAAKLKELAKEYRVSEAQSA